MQTLYYSTPNFIRHTGNVIDLCEYREKLARATEGEPARPLSQERSEAPAHRHARSRVFFSSLDLLTSIAILLMTITIMYKFCL